MFCSAIPFNPREFFKLKIPNLPEIESSARKTDTQVQLRPFASILGGVLPNLLFCRFVRVGPNVRVKES